MDIDNIIVLILVFLLFLFIVLAFIAPIKGIIEGAISDYKNYKEMYDFSTAVIIDTHIGYTRFGTPTYHFVYKFSSGAIKQVEVQAEEYYIYLSENFSEGS